VDRDRALELARARLFSLRALPWEELLRLADAHVVQQEEVGSGGLHCRFVTTRYARTEVEGEDAVRVTVNVEDGGWPVLEEDLEFVRFD
jgi:hypothetical protein